MIPLREAKERLLFNRVPVVTQDKPSFNVEAVIANLQRTIPSEFVGDIDYISIADSSYLEEREIESAYLDGVVYMLPSIKTDEEATLTIVHEIAHSLEEAYPQIYEDESIEAEFLGKRRKLYEILDAHGLASPDVDFMNAEYSEKFDDFLYLQVGYPILRNLSSGLFLSPYAATSVREYFADAFEEYFMRDPKYVKLISPSVYFKIEKLLERLGERFI